MTASDSANRKHAKKLRLSSFWGDRGRRSLVPALMLSLLSGVMGSGQMPEALAQVNPNPSIFNEPPFNRVPRQPQPQRLQPAPGTIPEEPQQEPDTIVTPVNGRASIRFINNTGAEISYQVIGDTQFRTLAGRSEMTLQDLPLPVNFTFRRQDSGLLQVTLQPNDPASGTLTVSVIETTDFSIDRTSLYIDQTGAVFLN